MQLPSNHSYIAIAFVVVGSVAAASRPSAPARLPGSVDISIFASGLNDPRGLTFGHDGHLIVAEGGSGGGSLSTIGLCDQVSPPVGPFVGGNSGRILGFSAPETSIVIASGLPSTEASPAIGGDKSSAAAVAFQGQELFTLISGAGCSHGHIEADNGIYRVGPNGLSMVANLSEWLLANPGAKGAQAPRNPDYEPDGTWYSMIFEQGWLYTVEPNHGLLVAVHPTKGRIELVSDLFATFGDHTYASLAVDSGDLYVGTLGQIAFLSGIFPPVPDLEHSFEAGIYKISRSGRAEHVVSGLHAVLGIAFDRRHRMYAMQSPIFVPGTGSFVRINDDGSFDTLVSGLTFPSAVVRGPDDAFYLSHCGYHCAPGDGQVMRISVQ